jgi:VanZ family protein
MIVVMGTIFFLSSKTNDELSLPAIEGLDKILHGIAYGTLAITMMFAFSPEFSRRRSLTVMLLTIAGVLLYGVSDEFHQSFVPGREVSAMDVLADVCGGTIAVLIFRGFQLRQPFHRVMKSIREKG